MSQRRHSSFLLWAVVITLAVPTIPFLLLGWWLEPAIESLAVKSADLPIWQSVGLTIIGLSADIFLPVPSSVLLTYAGRVLGGVQGTLAGWIGLNLSAAIGYWCSQKYGPLILNRFSTADAVEDVDRLGGNWPIWWSLVACRPLPILAEASVLVAGLRRVPKATFWPPVLAANFVIAVAYCWLGEFSAQHDWFASALVVSMALPLTFVLTRLAWKKHRSKKRVTI